VTFLANILLDCDGRIRQWDARAERLFGFAGAAALGRHSALLHAGGNGTVDALLLQAAQSGYAEHEGRCVREDGGAFPAYTLVTAMGEGGGPRGYSMFIRDLAEHPAALPELRGLLSAAIAEGEAERTRIARALREELGDTLAALRMDLLWLAQGLMRYDARYARRAERMRETVEAVVASMRRIAAILRPAELDNLGLVPAVEQLLRETSERAGIPAGLDPGPGSAALREPLATSVYRIVQQAVEYVARHTGAAAIRVALSHDGDRLRIEVRGEGAGAGAGSPGDPPPYGLLAIRERAQALGGLARIGRAERGGILLEIAIPAGKDSAGTRQAAS
jgi:two-component system sensor kinase